jgi:hypothetical protein
VQNLHKFQEANVFISQKAPWQMWRIWQVSSQGILANLANLGVYIG